MGSAPGCRPVWVVSVTENEPVAMQAAAYAPTSDAGSLYTTTLQTGAQAY
jgi:hypothetical protein